MSLQKSTVQWELMLPEEFRAAMAALPVCFMPLGTVEWHGEHDALGLDSIKAHALCVRAAEKVGGGIVHPPLYGGMGGLNQPATVKIEGEQSWENAYLRPWLERLCSEFHRLDFKAVIMITGHYGHNQQIVVREAAVRMSERLQIPVLGTPEYWLAHDAGYLGDHAGIGETSLLWHLHPDLVAIDRIDNDPVYSKGDRIKNGSSPELGKKYADLIIDRLATLARAMPSWDSEKLRGFIRAERALVSAQVSGWRNEAPWAAWNGIRQGEHTGYGQLLVDEDFKGVEKLAEQLYG
ncbi:MAG: creatininase family protein [Candidatus Latescibacteria bacterium]|nr:creatininase family protein [Candidatus Latescibacterota bacterium]